MMPRRSPRCMRPQSSTPPQAGAAHLEMRNRIPREPEWPHQDLYVTFRKEILPDLEANMNAIPRKQRAMVRKGIKFGLASEIDPGIDRFFDMYADNVHRHGTPPFPKAYFAELKRVFGDACESMIVVDADGKPVSGVLSFYFRDEVLPYYAGDYTTARDLAANDFKYWELMRRACERGVQGGSTTVGASAAPGPSTSRRTGASSPSHFTTSTGCSGSTASPRTIR